MQAAPGASLTDADTPVTTRRRALLLFGLVAATFYAVDVVTKIVAVDRLEGRPDVVVVDGVLSLTLVRNPGAAFSAGTQLTELLSVAAIIAVAVVLWQLRRLGSTFWGVGLGFLLAGVAGNLTDRLLRAPGPLRGEVIDFFRLPNWPVFNVAEVCINVAAGLIIIQAFRGVHLDGTREPSRAEERAAREEREAREARDPERDESEPGA